MNKQRLSSQDLSHILLGIYAIGCVVIGLGFLWKYWHPIYGTLRLITFLLIGYSILSSFFEMEEYWPHKEESSRVQIIKRIIKSVIVIPLATILALGLSIPFAWVMLKAWRLAVFIYYL